MRYFLVLIYLLLKAGHLWLKQLKNTLKIRILSQTSILYTPFGSLSFSYCKYWSPPVKTCANKRTYTKDKNLVSNQHTLFYSSRFSRSGYGSPPVKTCASKRTYTKDKNLVSNQHTLFYSSRFSRSGYGSPPVKSCASKRTLLEKMVAYSELEPAITWSSSQRSTNCTVSPDTNMDLTYTYPLPLWSENEVASYLYDFFINNLYGSLLIAVSI